MYPDSQFAGRTFQIKNRKGNGIARGIFGEELIANRSDRRGVVRIVINEFARREAFDPGGIERSDGQIVDPRVGKGINACDSRLGTHRYLISIIATQWPVVD